MRNGVSCDFCVLNSPHVAFPLSPEYIEHYNYHRPHQSLVSPSIPQGAYRGSLSPVEKADPSWKVGVRVGASAVKFYMKSQFCMVTIQCGVSFDFRSSDL